MRALLEGFLLGFSIAAPVGPIGVLCIRRTLADGRAIGFACGMGAATADTAYALVAAFGTSAAQRVLVDHALPIRLVGAAFLLYLGAKTFLAAPAQAAAEAGPARSLLAAWSSTFVLTITNPATILSFAAMFSALSLSAKDDARALVGGVFCGSATWWALLSGGVGALRARVTPARLRWVNRLGGAVLVAFAFAAIASTLR